MHTDGSRNIQEYSLHTPLVILHFWKVLHIIPLHIEADIPASFCPHTNIWQNKIERWHHRNIHESRFLLQSRSATLEIIPYLFWSWCSTIILLSQGKSREDSWFHFPVIRIPCDVWNPDMIHKTQDKTCIQIDQETFKIIHCTPHWSSCIF